MVLNSKILIMRNLILLFMLVIGNSFSAQDSNDIKAIQSQMNTKELDKLSLSLIHI